MESWQEELVASITDPEELAARFNMDAASLRPVTSRYPFRITPSYLSLIETAGDPIWRQCVPDLQEIIDESGLADPLCEDALSPVPGLVHRYPDRVVLLVSRTCAVHCRFCLRKHRVGIPDAAGEQFDLERAVQYLKEHGEVHDVILSGGDPLLLSDERLAEILGGLRGIPTLQIIRIGSRLPVTLPSRITDALCQLLKRFHPLYVNTHFNHPREITPATAAACGRLADAGIQLGNQSVLLKGVNDDPAVMKELMRQLLTIRVRPYYIHQMDLVQGTHHFRTPVKKGLEIMAALRGHCSGLATPHYVIDAPGGKGKVPLLPNYGREEQGRWRLTNYQGEEIDYPDVE
jgi:lysine 2,3-aminomutase